MGESKEDPKGDRRHCSARPNSTRGSPNKGVRPLRNEGNDNQSSVADICLEDCQIDTVEVIPNGHHCHRTSEVTLLQKNNEFVDGECCERRLFIISDKSHLGASLELLWCPPFLAIKLSQNHTINPHNSLVNS